MANAIKKDIGKIIAEGTQTVPGTVSKRYRVFSFSGCNKVFSEVVLNR